MTLYKALGWAIFGGMACCIVGSTLRSMVKDMGLRWTLTFLVKAIGLVGLMLLALALICGVQP